MKNKSQMSKLSLTGLSCLALVVPAMAIPKPAEADAPKEKNKEAAAEEAPKQAEKPAEKFAMLGVGGMTASETLSMHLGLEAGTGLTLYRIVPGSAAEKAGLKAHDVLTEFDGKKISNQQDLREAVLAKKPGDEVKVKFFSRGKAQEKNVVLGERKDHPRVQPMPGINPEWLPKNMGFEMIPGNELPMNEELRKRIEKLHKQLQQQGAGMNLNLGELLKDAKKGKKGGGMFKFDAQTSITLMDKEGSITMNTKDGRKSVIVKDKDGKVQFDGPYETEQDKAAVPEEIRERIDRLGIQGNGNGMKLRILPMGGGGLPPAEDKPAEPAE